MGTGIEGAAGVLMGAGAIEAALARELGVKPVHVGNVAALIDGGCTVPFIARYRKEAHGSTDDQLLRHMADRLRYLRDLDARRAEVYGAIGSQGGMTDALADAIRSAGSLAALEDIYRPYVRKRKTRAAAARERGLGPLADAICAQDGSGGTLAAMAAAYVDPDRGVMAPEDALAGASDIIAEAVSEDAGVRAMLRRRMGAEGKVLVTAVGEGNPTYSMYSGFTGDVGSMKGHWVLAINRGEREGFLKVALDCGDDGAKAAIRGKVVKGVGECSEFVGEAADDAYDRLIAPSMEREWRAAMTDRACERAIRTFADNLRPALMQPPVKGAVVMGFDPAYRTGCKVAVVDGTGALLETGVVYPVAPHGDAAAAANELSRMIRKHKVGVIALGNGTASRESEAFLAGLVKGFPEVSLSIVSEAGASVYSASKLGASEFPGLDVSLRSAVSIARRLQDPLAELVKIDPKSMGLGQYQHDMPEARLGKALTEVVEDCVNAVGVDLNTASPELLSYVSGLGPATASGIVRYRDENGPFAYRGQLRKVPRIGPKAYEQCAGFLRVPGGGNALDATGVHPESYGAAEALLSACGYSVADVAGGGLGPILDKVRGIGEKTLADRCGIGVPTLLDIAAELARPGRDPRERPPKPVFRGDVTEIADLRVGMSVRGTVRNVTDFGAFIDIGVHQDGLAHVSEIADRYIRHPSEALSVGDDVDATVLAVDAERKRISLSLKRRPDTRPSH